MISNDSLVLYKNSPAVIVSSEAATGKYTVKFQSTAATATKKAVYSTQNIREKDFVFLYNGPVNLEKSIELSLNQDLIQNYKQLVKEAQELILSDSDICNNIFTLEDLSVFAGLDVDGENYFAFYLSVAGSFSFVRDEKSFADGKILFRARSMEETLSLEKKALEKEQEGELRQGFIQRLKDGKLLPGDAKFMQEVESFALGQCEKSKVMHEAHFKETVERAHKALLDTGIWSIFRNPYPMRYGLSTKSANISLSLPPEEDRFEVSGISFAIDNEWSTDPDDAIGFDGKYLWVHIADPASTVMPGSQIDENARGRGATLYLPEGAVRMLSEDCLEEYALGLKEKSRALSFKILLDQNGNVEDCEVLKTFVHVKRLTYFQADELKETAELKPLFEIAQLNEKRRIKNGAVSIEIPEIHISVDLDKKSIQIQETPKPESAAVVREMMLLAGEGAAKFAFRNNIPFPFITQESPDIPKDLPEGLAREFRLRKCMRKRSVGVTPGSHGGLGLGFYSQVTSPLRRYGDLIAHMQLRAFIDGKPLLDKDTMLERISAGDAAGVASHQAERKSRMHWILVYLLSNPLWTGDAVCVDNSGKIPQFFIRELGLEAMINPGRDVELNEIVKVKGSNINLPELTCDFIVI